MIRACDTGRDPTGSRPAVTPQHTPTIGISAKKLAQHTPSSGISAKKLAQHARKRGFGAIFRALGELFRARTLTRPSRANFFAHRTRPRANFETNNTSPATDAGQHETAGTTARPQQATIETGNTTATGKCTKNAHFAPTKATTVSIEARPAPAKATGVSDNRLSWPTGPGCGTRGRRRDLAGHHTDTPIDWRPPRGLRGLAGLRADAPSEARGADGERAGRPRGGRRSVGATSNTKPPGPTGGRAAHASGR